MKEFGQSGQMSADFPTEVCKHVVHPFWREQVAEGTNLMLNLYRRMNMNLGMVIQCSVVGTSEN